MSHTDQSTDRQVPLEHLVERFFGPRPAAVKFTFGASSHQGKVREDNEDHYVVTRRRKERFVLDSNLPAEFQETFHDDAFVMAVADGMGGQAFGKLASMMALRVGMGLGTDEIKWSTKINEAEAQELKEKIEAFMRLIDHEINSQMENHRELVGMGTTLTVAYTVGKHAFIAHVGDSRAYLMRGHSLSQLTRDHTIANELLDAGMISRDTRHFRRLSHMLSNCLGGPGEGVSVESHWITLEDGDRLLICSDGLTDMVAEDEIKQVLLEYLDCQQATDALVASALDHGGKDNVTVIVGQFQVLADSSSPSV